MSCEHKGGDWSDAPAGIARRRWKLGERGMKQILPQSPGGRNPDDTRISDF